MSGKFMKIKRITVPIITVLMISSQLVGCASASSKEMLNMLENQQSITIEVAAPESVEQGTEKEYAWTELASLNTYSDFRQSFDDLFGINAFGVGGKNGSAYVDLEGNQTNNSTLYYAFMNEKFVEAYESSDIIKVLTENAKSNYADVETDAVARKAALNAYFNVFKDNEPNYFNGGSTLTRAEFMAGVFRAQSPVFDLSVDESTRATFESLVGADENSPYAYYLNDFSYLNTDDSNLNKDTFNGTITRAEAVYMLVQMYYSDDYKETTGKETAFGDVKNGGDIASKQGFIVTDKKTDSVTIKDYWKSYELSYALQHADKGMPNDLYRAMVVARKNNLITATESRWDEGITKAEALDLLVTIYRNLDPVTNADRGNATGEVVDTVEEEKSNEVVGYVLSRDDIDPDVHTTYDDSTGKVEIDQTMLEALSTCNKAFDTSSYDATLADAEFYMVMYHLGDLEKEIWFEFCETGDLNLIFGEGEEDSHTAMRDEWNSIYNNDNESLTTPVTPDTNTPAQEPASRPSTTPSNPGGSSSSSSSSSSSTGLTPEEQAAFDAAAAGDGGVMVITGVDPDAGNIIVQ